MGQELTGHEEVGASSEEVDDILHGSMTLQTGGGRGMMLKCHQA
jgi:hypothetical protein